MSRTSSAVWTEPATVRVGSGLMASLLAPPVTAAESFGAYAGDWRSGLFPAEARVVEQAADKRRHEFAGVRLCARGALDALQVGPVPLLPGKRGEPRWPLGVVGSMTHCVGYRAAAVARSGDGVAGVGIDAEPHAPLSAEALEMVASPQEQQHLEALRRRRPEVCWGRVLFSVKEAVFKAWYPLARCELDFLEAEVALWVDHGDSGGGFRAAVAPPGPFAVVSGRWRVARGLITSAVVVR